MKTASVAASLGALSRRWLSRGFRFRKRAVRRLVRNSGFAPRQAETLLDALFLELTASKLLALLRAEIGGPRVLDGPVRGRRARGPRRITHVFAGNIPNPAVQSLVHGLLVQSGNIVKPSSRDEGIIDLYVQSLRAHDRKLAARCSLLDASDRAGLRRAIASSDLVVAYGSDESVAAVRALAGPRALFVGYGNRVSFSLVTRGRAGPGLARKTAIDAWMADRRGCLSPALVFVEDFPGREAFCREVLRELSALEKGEGPARGDLARAAAVRAVSREAKIDAGSFFSTTPKGRYFVRAEKLRGLEWNQAPGVDIRVFRKIGDVFRLFARSAGARRAVPPLQAAALECAPDERKALSEKLSALGFNRVCRAGRLQFPPAAWRHDGRPNLAGWILWTDLG